MNRRVEVSKEVLASVFQEAKLKMDALLGEKGRGSLVTPHEILGVLDEEYDELREAVRSNIGRAVYEELKDIAVGALFGMASMTANFNAAKDSEPDNVLSTPMNLEAIFDVVKAAQELCPPGEAKTIGLRGKLQTAVRKLER